MASKYPQALKAGVLGGLALAAIVIFITTIASRAFTFTYSPAFECISQLLTTLTLACTGVLAVRFAKASPGSVLDAAIISAVAGIIAGAAGAFMVCLESFCIQLLMYHPPASYSPAVTYIGPLSGFTLLIDLVIIFLYASSGLILAPIGGTIYALIIPKIPAPEKPMPGSR